MAALTSLFLLAAASAGPADGRAEFQPRTGATVAAQATVRIVSGSRVTLGKEADIGAFHVTKATVRVEDDSRRPAQLVEFQ